MSGEDILVNNRELTVSYVCTAATKHKDVSGMRNKGTEVTRRVHQGIIKYQNYRNSRRHGKRGMTAGSIFTNEIIKKENFPNIRNKRRSQIQEG